MTLLLDTDRLDAPDRADAVRQALSMTCTGTRVAFDDSPLGVTAQMNLWTLGSAAQLFTTVSTGLTIQLPSKPLAVPAEQLSITLHEHAGGRHLQHGVLQEIGPDDTTMIDMTAAYRWQAIGYGPSRAVIVDVDTLGLTVDDVRRAIPTFRQNPLRALVHSHLAQLFARADELAASPAAAAIGAATVDLLRALVQVPLGGAHTRQARYDTLLARVTSYVRTHLREPDLSPARVAAAHHISVRHLHAVWSSTGSTLEQWVMAERLAGARVELHAPGPHVRSIAQIAHDWGFTDASHFSRRFRHAYQVTPGDFRRQARSA
ncbi:helix-turn-helix domain-containing protein [Cryptosporangium aurantiacum]|uniref:AraC-type DNA-binding protein n=1 Tax=Cryptosporangium aurantiacum TaxID=134849 RepID=A0A1M7RN69_9ACTN|nr:AraC family transcriptional regulator [Cryptosporangium aurantiacum]SHN47651.1 AraC-type DNA-binding protein [Cryptosporangium aurantiacum]